MNKSATPLASGQRFPPLRIGLNVPQVVVIPHTDIPLAKGLGNGLWHLRPGFDQFSPHLLHPRHHPLATAATLGAAMTSGLTLTFTASSTSRPAKSRCQAEVDGTHHLH